MGVKAVFGKIGGVLATIAPTLGLAIGGPLGATAGQFIKQALGKPEATDDEIEALIATGSPETILALKQADQDFQKFIADNDLQLVQADNADRASAREREKALKDWTPSVLAAAITIGFFGVLAGVMIGGLPDTGADAVLLLLGSLGASFTAVMGYYFGSSAGSRRKDERAERIKATN